MRRWVQQSAAVIAIVLIGSVQIGRAAPPGQPLPHASEGRCPKLHMESLGADAVGRAAMAALGQARAVYPGTRLKGMRVTKAVLARFDDPGRGGYARVKCGRRAQARTVVVYLEFPAMRPSASLSQGVVLVSKFAGEYRVWAQLH